MSFPGDAIDVVDLRALADGGFVLEDVYRKVFFLQTAPDTPFTNLIGTRQQSQSDFARRGQRLEHGARVGDRR